MQASHVPALYRSWIAHTAIGSGHFNVEQADERQRGGSSRTAIQLMRSVDLILPNSP